MAHSGTTKVSAASAEQSHFKAGDTDYTGKVTGDPGRHGATTQSQS